MCVSTFYKLCIRINEYCSINFPIDNAIMTSAVCFTATIIQWNKSNVYKYLDTCIYNFYGTPE